MKELRDELVQEHELSGGEWVLVRHENPQKFEPKWFLPTKSTNKWHSEHTNYKIPAGRSYRLFKYMVINL
jgi:hypothetical protein